MEYHPFPALLRAAYNDTRVFGQAAVNPAGTGLDFSAGFVPLLPLAYPAVIDWVHGQQTAASFSGEVYLSSPTRLRLVSLDAELLTAARSTFAVNTHLAASTLPVAGGGPAQPCEILYLSRDYITLKTAHTYADDTALSLNCEVDFLTLCELGLRVRQQLALGRGENLLFCDVLPGGNDNLIALSAYTARLEQLEL